MTRAELNRRIVSEEIGSKGYDSACHTLDQHRMTECNAILVKPLEVKTILPGYGLTDIVNYGGEDDL